MFVDVFVHRHAHLKTKLITFDRDEGHATQIPIIRNQRIEIVACQLNFSWLVVADRSFKHVPTFFYRLNLRLGRLVTWNCAWGIFDDAGVFCPKGPTQNRGMMSITPVEPDGACGHQDKNENGQNETAFGKAAHSSLRGWRFDPAIRHVCARFSMSILTCASINLS